MAATGFVTTVTGAATSFLPLTTPGTSVGTACAAAIYKQANDGNFLGWDPWWVTEVNTALSTCWPSQATLWWNQDSSETTTVLGEAFVCPTSYHEVLTSSIDSYTTQTFCCPTSYSLYNVEFGRAAFPSQCISTLTSGQTLSYRTVSDLDSGSSTNSATSSTVWDETITIYGIPVNGLNVVSSTSVSAISSTDSVTKTTSTGAGGEVVTVTASASASLAQSSSSTQGGHVSTVGVAVGASIGAVAGIMLLGVGVFIIWRRKRRDLKYPVSATALEMDAPLGGSAPGHMSSMKSPEISNYVAELTSDRQYEAYELPVDTHKFRGGGTA